MTTYYVTQDGAGGSTGADWDNAWSLSALNALWGAVISPGDIIYIGDQFTQAIEPAKSGTAGNVITIRGDDPARPATIYGGTDVSTAGQWSNVDGNNLWRCSLVVNPILGRVPMRIWLGDKNTQEACKVVINEEKSGSDTTTPQDLFAQGQVWWDRVNYQYVVYSVGNPADYYSAITIPTLRSGVTVDSYDYITVQGVTVTHCMLNAFRAEDANNVTFTQNSASWCGGALSNSGNNDAAGDCISFNENCDTPVATFNTVDQAYDIAVGYQAYGATPYTITNIDLSDNTITNSAMGVSIAAQSDQAHSITGVIARNTVTDSGAGWCGTDNSTHGVGVGIKETTLSTVTVTLEHNLISGAYWCGIRCFGGHGTIKYNKIINGADEYTETYLIPSGIALSGGSTSQVAGEEFEGEVYGNVVSNCEGCGILVLNNQAVEGSVEIYRNAIYNCGSGDASDYAAVRTSSSSNVLFKENIVVQENTPLINSTNSSFTSDYNVWYTRNSANEFLISGVSYNFADLKVLGSDLNSVSQDPLFYDPVNNDLEPTGISSTLIGLVDDPAVTSTEGIDRGSSWPDSVLVSSNKAAIPGPYTTTQSLQIINTGNTGSAYNGLWDTADFVYVDDNSRYYPMNEGSR